MTAAMTAKKLSTTNRKNEVSPKIVQLGSALPSRFPDVTDMWVPVSPDVGVRLREEIPVTSPHLHSQSPKQPKYRNLYEYNKKHGQQCQLSRSLWKIPNLSSNLLPVSKVVVDTDKSKKEREQSEYVFKDVYSRLKQNKTQSLPPLKAVVNGSETTNDPYSLEEKRYIAQQLKSAGPMETFARDSVYLPQVYPQCFTCKDCRKSYISDVYSQKFARRNNLSLHGHVGVKADGRLAGSHHCDVLGERYCNSCIEARNKRFSRYIEEGLYFRDGSLSKIHYRRTR